jgi:hypothetical protein
MSKRQRYQFPDRPAWVAPRHVTLERHRLKAVFAATLIIGAAIGAGLAVLVLAVFP